MPVREKDSHDAEDEQNSSKDESTECQSSNSYEPATQTDYFLFHYLIYLS